VSGQEPVAPPPDSPAKSGGWWRHRVESFRAWRKRRRRTRALLAVWPRVYFPHPPVGALHPPDADTKYPFLTAKIAVADDEVFPAFEECDRDAQIEQNRWRWFTVLALAGGLITTVFGAAQAWLQSAWPGVVVVTAGAATTAVTTLAKRQGSLERYRDQRLRAERLRSLYYAYLVDSTTDAAELKKKVALARYGRADR
jgi:hypothetical protein